jgi:hypothetical protein
MSGMSGNISLRIRDEFLSTSLGAEEEFTAAVLCMMRRILGDRHSANRIDSAVRRLGVH